MIRWVFDFGLFYLRIHYWKKSDDPRAFHNHAWWFLTFVLWGGYDDITPEGIDHLRMFSVRFRHANHKHTVQITKPGTITILITGKFSQRWSFWINGKRFMRDKYFAIYGHHPCNDGEPAIRRRPDGSRI